MSAPNDLTAGVLLKHSQDTISRSNAAGSSSYRFDVEKQGYLMYVYVGLLFLEQLLFYLETNVFPSASTTSEAGLAQRERRL